MKHWKKPAKPAAVGPEVGKTTIRMPIRSRSRKGAVIRKAIVIIRTKYPLNNENAGKLREQLHNFDADPDRKFLLFNVNPEDTVHVIRF